MTIKYGLLVGKNGSNPVSDMDRANGSILIVFVAIDPTNQEMYAHSGSEPNLPQREDIPRSPERSGLP